MSVFTSSIIVLITAVIISFAPTLFLPKLPKKGQGYAAPGWIKVGDAFRELLDSGEELGGALALYHRGELVVEFVGGYADPAAKWAWDKDTLTLMCSSSKAVAAVTMAMLVDRGYLEYGAEVRRYWPEFAQNGKEDITVDQLFSHQAGLAVLDTPMSAYALLDDPEQVGSILAEQKPNWTPGSGHGYHGVSLGLYQDQLVRRVDPQHRSLAAFFQDNVARPHGIDVYIGLPKEEVHRTARTTDFSLLSWDLLRGQRYWPVLWQFLTNTQSLIYKSVLNPRELAENLENNNAYREIPNPSTHGFGTALGAAKLMATVANGGISPDQPRLLSKEMIELLSEPLTSGVDKVLLMNVTYGRGVTLRESPLGSTMLGAPGAGGQMLFADPRYQLGIAYFTNHFSLFAIGDDPRYLKLERAIYECVQDLERKHGPGGGGSGL